MYMNRHAIERYKRTLLTVGGLIIGIIFLSSHRENFSLERIAMIYISEAEKSIFLRKTSVSRENQESGFDRIGQIIVSIGNPAISFWNIHERNTDSVPEDTDILVDDGREALRQKEYNKTEDSKTENNKIEDNQTEIATTSGQSVQTLFQKEQLADYDFLMQHFYSVHASTTAERSLMNAEKFLNEKFYLQKEVSKPQILIYHTHSQESYSDYSIHHPDATVVGVGNYLAELLEEKGYGVIHDTDIYDLKDGVLDRNHAYNYALEGITGILQKNPSIEVILDIHRDGVRENVHMVSEINGKPTAPVMFFNGMSQTPDGNIEYLPNLYREDNLAFSFQLQWKASMYYPGLTRKIYLKGLRYNMHLRPRSALIEVGAQTNTSEEAKNAMEPLAELLDMVLQEK